MSELVPTILALELEAKRVEAKAKELADLARQEAKNIDSSGRPGDPKAVEALIKDLRKGIQAIVAGWTKARGQLGDDPLVGKSLGPCRIERKLREGTMFLLFQAIHVRLKRRTFMKVLRPELSSREDLVARLRKETLEDPFAVNMGEEKGLYYVELSEDNGSSLDL